MVKKAAGVFGAATPSWEALAYMAKIAPTSDKSQTV
jgi:hypothetical protein